MTIIRRPSPFGELYSLRQAMDRLFEDTWMRPRSPGGEAERGLLPLDIYRTNDALVVKAALPGIKPEDVEITIEGDALTISGEFREERTEQGERGYLFQELRRGSLSRTVQLPGDVNPDSARADYEHGVLTLTLPKREEAKARQIRISPTSDVQSTAVAGGSADGQPSGGR